MKTPPGGRRPLDTSVVPFYFGLWYYNPLTHICKLLEIQQINIYSIRHSLPNPPIRLRHFCQRPSSPGVMTHPRFYPLRRRLSALTTNQPSQSRLMPRHTIGNRYI